MNINGDVVLVTGASSGIGEATARAAFHAGAKLVLMAVRKTVPISSPKSLVMRPRCEATSPAPPK